LFYCLIPDNIPKEHRKDDKLDEVHGVIEPEVIFPYLRYYFCTTGKNITTNKIIKNPLTTLVKFLEMKNKGDQNPTFDPPHNIKNNQRNMHFDWV
jgi:hypothetical protein